MPAEIQLSPEAESELRAAYLWYLDRDLLVAEAFKAEVTHALKSVSEAPDRWPLMTDRVRRYVLPRFPFSIVYRTHGSLVDVVAIAHQKRKPGYWRKDETGST